MKEAEAKSKGSTMPLLQTLKTLDEKVSLAMSLSASKESPLGYLRPHMKGLELSCHGVFWISACCIGLWLSVDPLKETYFFNLLVALFLDCILVAILKASISRSRPQNNESGDMFLTWSVDKMSCPSGHTSRAVLMALLLISSSKNIFYILHPLLMLWSVATCLSRVLLGRHHLGDVLIGMVLGYAEFILMTHIWAAPETAKWYLDFFGDSDGVVDDL